MTEETDTSASEIIGGRFRVERELGRGGMATVFLCSDTERGDHLRRAPILEFLGLSPHRLQCFHRAYRCDTESRRGRRRNRLATSRKGKNRRAIQDAIWNALSSRNQYGMRRTNFL